MKEKNHVNQMRNNFKNITKYINLKFIKNS